MTIAVYWVIKQQIKYTLFDWLPLTFHQTVAVDLIELQCECSLYVHFVYTHMYLFLYR